MKIESTSQPLAVSSPSSVPGNKKVQDKQPEHNKTELKDATAMRDRMHSWFSRAGIFIDNSAASQSDINRRVSHQQHVKAQRRMRNLERIMGLAVDYSIDQHSSDDLDADWFFSFVDMAENIHGPAMQELWGKIFAVEVSQPGTFSIGTLQTLKQLTQRDAKILKLAVSLSSRKKAEHGLKIVFGFNQKPSVLSLFSLRHQPRINLSSYGLAYPDILSLMDLGLLYSSEIESGEFRADSRSQYRCCGQTFHLSAKKRGLTLTYYKFTSTGTELAKLVQGKYKQSYLDDLKHLLNGVFEVT